MENNQQNQFQQLMQNQSNQQQQPQQQPQQLLQFQQLFVQQQNEQPQQLIQPHPTYANLDLAKKIGQFQTRQSAGFNFNFQNENRQVYAGLPLLSGGGQTSPNRPNFQNIDNISIKSQQIPVIGETEAIQPYNQVRNTNTSARNQQQYSVVGAKQMSPKIPGLDTEQDLESLKKPATVIGDEEEKEPIGAVGNKRVQKQAAKTAQKNQKNTIEPSESHMGDTETNRQFEKRRGRKRERDDLYFIKAQQRIEDLKAQLRTAKQDGMPVKQRQRLRNQVSAQQSRIKRKEESMVLHNIVKEKDEKFEEFLEFLGRSLGQDKIHKINSHFLREWNVSDSLLQGSGLDIDNYTSVEQTRPNSVIAVTNDAGSGDLPGFGKLVEFFSTKQEELDQFKQNDEKQYDEDSEN